LRYDFFGIGTEAGDRGLSIPLRQDQTAGLLQLVRRISKSSFLGPRLRYRDTQNVLSDSEEVTGLPPPGSELNATTVGLGLHFEDDTRDAIFYPRSGHLFHVYLDFFDDAWGSDFTYQIATVAYTHYFPVRERDVFAIRGYGRFSFGDVPFFDLSLFGRRGDLRGYIVGQYRDRMLAAIQAEYRFNFAERWGAVAFAGVGQVAPDLDVWSSDDLLPSAGVGLRYTVAMPTHLNLRLDLAWGREDFGVYLGITEVF
jgi:outer membrane translocation and assembly module TamA